MTTAERTEPQQTAYSYIRQIPAYSVVRNTVSDRRYIFVRVLSHGEGDVPVRVMFLSITTGQLISLDLDYPTAVKYVIDDAPVDYTSLLPTLISVHTGTRDRVETLERLHRRAENDFNIVAGRIQQESEDRGWCDEYDTIVDDVNSQLQVFHMPTRKKDYDVEVIVSLTYQVTVRVDDCANGDEARERVEDMSPLEIIREASGSMDCYDDYDVDVQDAEVV